MIFSEHLKYPVSKTMIVSIAGGAKFKDFYSGDSLISLLLIQILMSWETPLNLLAKHI